jgi:hypothetical protein
MIVGWAVQTPSGVRLYRSQMGRFFRDVVHARARETIVFKMNNMRNCAQGRRHPYLIHRQHLEYLLPRKVGISDMNPKVVA